MTMLDFPWVIGQPQFGESLLFWETSRCPFACRARTLGRRPRNENRNDRNGGNDRQPKVHVWGAEPGQPVFLSFLRVGLCVIKPSALFHRLLSARELGVLRVLCGL